MSIDSRYRGIFYMLLAALGFSLMGGAAKLLKGSFGAGQLVFLEKHDRLTCFDCRVHHKTTG